MAKIHVLANSILGFQAWLIHVTMSQHNLWLNRSPEGPSRPQRIWPHSWQPFCSSRPLPWAAFEASDCRILANIPPLKIEIISWLFNNMQFFSRISFVSCVGRGDGRVGKGVAKDHRNDLQSPHPGVALLHFEHWRYFSRIFNTSIVISALTLVDITSFQLHKKNTRSLEALMMIDC